MLRLWVVQWSSMILNRNFVSKIETRKKGVVMAYNTDIQIIGYESLYEERWSWSTKLCMSVL